MNRLPTIAEILKMPCREVATLRGVKVYRVPADRMEAEHAYAETPDGALHFRICRLPPDGWGNWFETAGQLAAFVAV